MGEKCIFYVFATMSKLSRLSRLSWEKTIWHSKIVDTFVSYFITGELHRSIREVLKTVVV